MWGKLWFQDLSRISFQSPPSPLNIRNRPTVLPRYFWSGSFFPRHTGSTSEKHPLLFTPYSSHTPTQLLSLPAKCVLSIPLLRFLAAFIPIHLVYHSNFLISPRPLFLLPLIHSTHYQLINFSKAWLWSYLFCLYMFSGSRLPTKHRVKPSAWGSPCLL